MIGTKDLTNMSSGKVLFVPITAEAEFPASLIDTSTDVIYQSDQTEKIVSRASAYVTIITEYERLIQQLSGTYNMAASSVKELSNLIITIVAIVTPISAVLGRRYIIKKDRTGKNLIYYAAAASTTAAAGILYLIMVPSLLAFNLNSVVLFLISGSFQLFYFVPMMKRWGRKWYYAGIIGTLLFMILIIGGTIYPITILGEILQAAYVVITGAIVIIEKRSRRLLSSHKTDKRSPV